MSRLRRGLVHAAAFLTLPVLVGAIGIRELRDRERPGLPSLDLVEAPRPELDPTKPTVVVVLGADLTEITDTLGPFETFARVGTYNVVTAASSRVPTLLTGGLRIVPHYTFDEVDRILGERAVDVVVVPNIPNIAATFNAPVLDWLKRQARRGALVHSWCTGAMTLAHAGLLDGRTGTAHWGDLPRLRKLYPRVDWIDGVRWIDHGDVVMSAGLTSGVDASLHVILRLSDEATARRVARELRYPDFQFVLDPTVEPYRIQPADAVHLANAAYRFGRKKIAVALYPGMSELDLSTLYDAHAYTTVAELEAVALEDAPVVTAHGLTLLPSRTVSRLGRVDRLIVPGVDARQRAASLLARLPATPAPELLHADAPDRFGLEPAIEDLARMADVPTARFALRRLEYRSSRVQLAGSRVPWRALGSPVALGMLGVFLGWAVFRRSGTSRAPDPRCPRPDSNRRPTV